MNDSITVDFEALTKELETIRNTDPQSLAMMEIGDEWRQGDLRIVRVDGDKIRGNLVLTVPQHQLAPGTSQGSRHCLDTTDGIEFFTVMNATVVDGPVIHATQPFSITHPEHGDCVDIPAGWYAFPGQRTFAEELRRVAD
jgi:hypothetical protein